MLKLQNTILKLIATGESLEATMKRLCLEIERLSPGVWCSVLSVGPNGLLHPLAGPRFPREYLNLLDGLLIGPEVGSCGSAAYFGQAVAVKDIDTDSRWTAFKHPALALGLRACWSSPIFDATGVVLGTFAFYFDKPRAPSRREEALVASCTSLCAIALERHQRVMEHERRAYVDALTNLPNRASFDVAIERLTSGDSDLWGIMMVDLDNLKTINDTFGHAAGDELLQVVGSRLAAAASPARVFRLGGDEFSIILQGAEELPDITDLAFELNEALSAPAICGGHTIVPRGTIGGALVSPGEDDVAIVRYHADCALYHAKEHQPGGFILYSSGIGSTIRTRVNAIRDVEHALSEGRIDAFYQPIIRLDTRQIVGLEALSRMSNSDGEIIAAAHFHQATSDVSVASNLTRHILTTVARDIRSWLECGLSPPDVSVNIASTDFHSGTLLTSIEEAFCSRGISLKHLVLEITESVYLGHRDAAVAREIKALRMKGLRIALDDFGTGFASLTHLLSVPVDIIKVDRSFVNRLVHGDSSLIIVEGLIQIARKLGIKVVAEGIETEQQAALLAEIGCRIGQGYLFSPAVPREMVSGLIERFSASAHNRETQQQALVLSKSSSYSC